MFNIVYLYSAYYIYISFIVIINECVIIRKKYHRMCQKYHAVRCGFGTFVFPTQAVWYLLRFLRMAFAT